MEKAEEIKKPIVCTTCGFSYDGKRCPNCWLTKLRVKGTEDDSK